MTMERSIVVGFLRSRRVVVASLAPPATSSWSQSCRRGSIVSPQWLSDVVGGPRYTPVSSAPLPPCRRAGRSPAVVAALAAASPCHRRRVVVPASPSPVGLVSSRDVARPPATRRPCVVANTPSSVVVVVVVATVIVAFAIIVAAVLVNTLGHGSRCRCRRPRGVVTVLGRISLVVTVVRRPSPRQPPAAGMTWDWDALMPSAQTATLSWRVGIVRERLLERSRAQACHTRCLRGRPRDQTWGHTCTSILQ